MCFLRPILFIHVWCATRPGISPRQEEPRHPGAASHAWCKLCIADHSCTVRYSLSCLAPSSPFSLQDKQQKARAWFGVGVALHMQREHETAIQAFQKAAKFAQVRAVLSKCLSASPPPFLCVMLYMCGWYMCYGCNELRAVNGLHMT